MEQIIFAGAHPDDFTGCCGTALRMRGKFDLHLWDFTRGERGLEKQGVPLDKCGAMRTAEETRVAQYVGAKLDFLGEIDGEAFAPQATCERIVEKLKRIQPRAIFTHFIPDRHPDHMMTAAAILRAVELAEIDPEIYFYEFSFQSLGFIPHYYVDITPVMDEKIKIIRMYECQNIEDSIVKNKTQIGAFRGEQIQVKYAEAFCSYGFQKNGKKTIFSEIQ